MQTDLFTPIVIQALINTESLSFSKNELYKNVTPPKEGADIVKRYYIQYLKSWVKSIPTNEFQDGSNGYRARISELRNKYQIDVQSRKIKVKNRFGIDIECNEHFLSGDMSKAICLLNKLNGIKKNTGLQKLIN